MLFSGLERQREIDGLLDRRFCSPDEKREKALKDRFAKANISQSKALLVTRRIQVRLKLQTLKTTGQRRYEEAAAVGFLTAADRALLAHDPPERRKADLQTFWRWHELRGTSALLALEEMKASICNRCERLTRNNAAPYVGHPASEAQVALRRDAGGVI